MAWGEWKKRISWDKKKEHIVGLVHMYVVLQLIQPQDSYIQYEFSYEDPKDVQIQKGISKANIASKGKNLDRN